MNARANTYLADISGYPDDANPAAAVAEVLAARGWKGKRVAIDQNAWFLTVNLHQRLVKEFGPLLDASGVVEELRRVKSPLELRQMEEAARANDAGMQAGLEATGRAPPRTTSPPPSWPRPCGPGASTSAWSRSSPPGRARASRTRRGAAGGSCPATS